MAALSALVSPQWLHSNLGRDDIKVLDGTWIMSGEAWPLPDCFIQGAQHFDIDQVADLRSPMKHMLPEAQVFEDCVSRLGIDNNDTIIIYDRHGIRAAPRVWWMFRMFGHEKIAILNGGLPAWIEAGFQTENRARPTPRKSQYEARAALSGVSTQEDILQDMGRHTQIIDARPAGRFLGTSPEPRAGLRSGHIPGSLSLPFSDLLSADLKYKTLDELVDLFRAAKVDLTKPIITSCGSGVTAAGLAFALHLLGKDDVSVYDGSWTEWGASDHPVSTAPINTHSNIRD